MAWYTTECLYRAEISGAPRQDKQLFEHRYFLLAAEDDESARKKALELAERKQHAYPNAYGENGNGAFERVIDTQEVLADQLLDETEIYHKYSDDPSHEL